MDLRPWVVFRIYAFLCRGRTMTARAPASGAYAVNRTRAVFVGGFTAAPADLALAASHELAWQDEGLCMQTDPEAFFVGKGGDVKPSKKICAACPVRAACLEYALENRDEFGVWGGTTGRQRRVILAARDRAAGITRCPPGRHVLTAASTLPNGKCAGCRDGGLRAAAERRLAKELAA